MAATTTLGVTSLESPISENETQVKVASTSGITAGMRLYADRELMSVVSPGPAGTSTFIVRRGVDGTLATKHTAAVPVFVGSGECFFSTDPQGTPPYASLVLPYINVRSGDIFVPQGDTDPKTSQSRWWQKMVFSFDHGTLGYRTMGTGLSEDIE